MAERPFDVGVVGSANLDLVARVHRIPSPGETVTGTAYAEHPGGKGLNQAVAASRSGARTAFVGRVGDDPAGERLRGVLRDDAIADLTSTDPARPTGRAMITVADDGENAIVVVAGANGEVPDEVSPPDASVLLLQLEIPLSAVVAVAHRARDAGSTVVLNPAPATPLPDELVACCDVIVPNEHEVDLLGGADGLLARGAGAVVVTLGAAGCEIVTADDRRRADPFEVVPIDTTGAGDAFCGALACRLATGDPLDIAVRWANAAGALATMVDGAVPAQPRAASIRQLLDR